MEGEKIVVEIDEKDGELFEFAKEWLAGRGVKTGLKKAAQLYNFCNDYEGVQGEYHSPEIFQKEDLEGLTKEELLQYKQEFEDELYYWIDDFQFGECDFGVNVHPRTGDWLIGETGRLGIMVLHIKYMKIVDELLKKLDKKS